HGRCRPPRGRFGRPPSGRRIRVQRAVKQPYVHLLGAPGRPIQLLTYNGARHPASYLQLASKYHIMHEMDATLSALSATLQTVGARWTLLVIAALLDGPRRFGELQQELSGIAPNVLSQRLRTLERDALVVARPYSERPPRFVYELTSTGRELSGVLRLLAG